MIYWIKIANGSDYYAKSKYGQIHTASTGSVYIKDFMQDMKIKHKCISFHPDIVYCQNGCHAGISNISPYDFKKVKNIPKWFYCYDKNIPLLKQLSEKEFNEFLSYDNSPCIDYYKNETYIKTYDKDWYINNGYR